MLYYILDDFFRLSAYHQFYNNRNGGYTRIVKLGFRDNDRASVALIEFVDMEGAMDSELVTSDEEKDSE